MAVWWGVAVWSIWACGGAAAMVDGVVTEGGSGILLEPLSGRSGDDKVLVMVHGALVNEEHYMEVCRMVQKASPLRLWVGLPSFVIDTPNPLQVSSAVKAMVKRVGAAANTTFAASDVAVGGHSLGGVFAPSVVKAQGYAAMVEWGSYVTQGQSISTTAYPVLTLAGELDGLTRVSRIALEVEKMMALPRDQWLAKPVVILPGVSHSQFCTGQNISGDNMPAVPWPQAQAGIANVTAAFLTTVFADDSASSSSTVSAATATLSASFNYTITLVSGFLAARSTESSTATAGPSSSWCATVQASVIFSQAALPYTMAVSKASNAAVLATIHPSTTNQSGVVNVNVVSYPSYAFNPIDVSTNKVAANTLTCEMMSYDALKVAQGDPNAGGAPVVANQCRAANAAAVILARALVTTATLRRYDAGGIPITLDDDIVDTTGPTFLASSLSFKIAADNAAASVSSTSLATTTKQVASFGGVYMCELMSPARVIEWMMVDGLPKI